MSIEDDFLTETIHFDLSDRQVEKILAFIRRAVAAEREECARAAESHPFSPAQMDDCARCEIAAAIRKRADA